MTMKNVPMKNILKNEDSVNVFVRSKTPQLSRAGPGHCISLRNAFFLFWGIHGFRKEMQCPGSARDIANDVCRRSRLSQLATASAAAATTATATTATDRSSG